MVSDRRALGERLKRQRERAGVTLAIQALEASKLIRSKRGSLTVLDRAGLEALARDAYGLAEAEYARVIGQAKGGAPLHHEPARPRPPDRGPGRG